MSGIYSDEIFKEQNKVVEDKVSALQLTKNDDQIQKYNLEAITIFIKEKLENIVQTFSNAKLSEQRTLLCLIFPQGLNCSGSTYLNTEISQYYRALMDLREPAIRCGGPRRKKLELFF